MKLFCRHEYKLLSETITKSKIEIAAETIKAAGLIGEYSTWQLPWQVVDASRKHIQVFSCSKCGNLKRFVEKI
jgi:hypothetical protein